MSTEESPTYVNHNLIVDDSIETREYQCYLAEQAKKESTLVVLPTGTGKTIVTLRIAASRLLEYRTGTCLLLAPTKPLVEQHAETYRNLLDISDDEIVLFTGDVRPDERKQIWNDSPSVVIATPQVIENDLISGRITLDDVIQLTLDECHRATGDYAYVYIADKYISQANNPLITGLSASPGDTKEDILQICENINVTSIEVITEDDPRIEPYLHSTQIDTRFVEISDEVLGVRDLLQEVYKERLEILYEDDYVDSRSKTLSNYKLRQAQGRIQQAMQKGEDSAYSAMSVWAEAMKLSIAIKLIETQGVEAFLEYYSRLESEVRSEDSSKAVQRLIADPKMQRAVDQARNYDGTYAKFEALHSELVSSVKIDGGKALVFTKSRDTVESLVEYLGDTFEVARLVGQTDKENSDGMTQKQQRDTIKKFGTGGAEVLISTQVGEEGLDISQVDLVVFYEPAQRGIEQIQRQGRTGRNARGRVLILIGEGTRDVGMYYKSKSSLETMQDDLSSLKDIENLQEEIEDELKENAAQMTLDEAFQSGNNKDELTIESTNDGIVHIIADSRETNSSVVRDLDVDDEVEVDIQNNLEVGDYIVGDDCAVERKDAEDFHATLTGNERSLFEQLGALSDAYDRPVLLLEGGLREVYTQNISREAAQGAVASAVSDYGVSIMESVNQKDTASMLKRLAKREQVDTTSKVNPHGRKRTKTLKDQQEYIVSSIEEIGPVTAEKLLEHFGNIQSIVNADLEELQEVENIGEENAKKIYSVVRTKYHSENSA